MVMSVGCLGDRDGRVFHRLAGFVVGGSFSLESEDNVGVGKGNTAHHLLEIADQLGLERRRLGNGRDGGKQQDGKLHAVSSLAQPACKNEAN